MIFRNDSDPRKMRRVSPQSLCPVCGKPDWCLVAPDGSAAICQRVESEEKRGGAGWLHRLKGDVAPSPNAEPQATQPEKDWDSEAQRLASNLSRGSPRWASLVRILGVPTETLKALRLLGYDPDDRHGRCFIFPECDATGRIIGLLRRYPEPLPGQKNKMRVTDSKAGLTLLDGWKVEGSCVVFVVEGATDTLAMHAAGLSCVGRPSNSGGSGHLAKLFRDLPADWKIVIVGENDKKSNQLWPGRDGAVAVATNLAADLRRPIHWTLPPDEAKDVRGWLTTEVRSSVPWFDRGAELQSLLLASAVTEDPPPVGRGRVTVPEYSPFPTEALPPVLREFVESTSAAVDCDPAFAALPALTLAGAAAGTAVVVSPKRRFQEPPALWCVVVGDSGTAKSPAARPSSDLALTLDAQLKAAYEDAVVQYADELKEWNNDDRGDSDNKPVKPTRARFVVSDTTIERLAEMIAASPRGLLLIRDELSGWFGGFTRYKGTGGDSDIPNWLSLFDSGPIRVHRRTGEPRDIESDRSFVAVYGGIQPGVLRNHLSNPAYVESGLAGRLVFAFPPKRCPRWTDVEPSEEAEQRFRDVLQKLQALPLRSDGKPSVVQLDLIARDRFKRLNDEFAERAEDQDGGPMAAVLPKAVRYALRLALVHHLVSCAAAGSDPLATELSDDSMQAGETLARWFVSEAERVYAMLAERPEERATRRLIDWVRRHGGRATTRDLLRSNSRDYPAAEDAEMALDRLVNSGLGRWEESAPPRGGHVVRTFVLSDTRRSTTPEPEPPSEVSDTRAALVQEPPETNGNSAERRVSGVSRTSRVEIRLPDPGSGTGQKEPSSRKAAELPPRPGRKTGLLARLGPELDEILRKHSNDPIRYYSRPKSRNQTSGRLPTKKKQGS